MPDQPAINAPLQDAITATLVELAGIPSVSGQEAPVRDYLRQRLHALGLTPTQDANGNLIARVPAVPPTRDTEAPILLNAHMDRVPPGLAHTPRLEHGILRSDGATNLGADDSAGLAIILHTVATLHTRALPHPPLLLLFTVGEEVGLIGATAFDPQPWGAREGIVFDNAAAPGVIIQRAATYIAFDITLHGRSGHPGKQLTETLSALDIFRHVAYPTGSLDGDITRVSIGRIEGGTARNAIPAELRLQGEVRTLLQGPARAAFLDSLAAAFTTAATERGGSAAITFDSHCDDYALDPAEPLLRAYIATATAQGLPPDLQTTFIGSDASALRRHTRVFVVSTGAMDEHTPHEWIALAPLAALVEITSATLSTY